MVLGVDKNERLLVGGELNGHVGAERGVYKNVQYMEEKVLECEIKKVREFWRQLLHIISM